MNEEQRRALVESLAHDLVTTRHTTELGALYAGPEFGRAWLERLAETVVDRGWRPAGSGDAHVLELEAAIDRVRALHDQDDTGLLAPGRWCPGCGEPTPCKTIRALNGRT